MMPKPRKKQSVEYRLLITPEFDDLHQHHTTLFVLETTRIFASFRYELSVQEQKNGKKIRYTILGLRPPQLSLPASGHAQFSSEYDHLRGTYQVEIEGLDGTVNTFSVRIGKNKVQLLKSPPAPFVEVIVDKSTWAAT